jgi:hypothetical protein
MGSLPRALPGSREPSKSFALILNERFDSSVRPPSKPSIDPM